VSPPRTIAELLSGKTVLLTGASGFLGKAVLARCLSDLPEIAEIRLLLRAADDAGARRRLVDEVLTSRPFEDVTKIDLDLALETGRLRALAADVRRERVGRADVSDLAGIDVVIHCAASVSFEQPLDEMLELNVLGSLNLVRAVREAGSDPDFVHVSTAYAAGTRTGLVLERASGTAPAEPELDLLAELEAARTWRRELESESRLPEHQQRFVRDAREEIGPAGDPAVGARAELARRFWVVFELMERGRQRSRALGWSDAYTLSKALAERSLLAENLRSLTIIRPSIIESAFRHPFPGWIEGLKVADPVILAYARGLISRFPSNPSVRFDLIPVDFVAGACLGAAAHPPPNGLRTANIASGSRNPLLIQEAARHITEYFQERPLPDEDGMPVEVGEWRFATRKRIVTALDRGERAVRLGRRIVERVPMPGGEQAERRLHQERRSLERLRRLADIYGPYVELDCMFDDRQARELLDRLHPDDRASFGWDTATIDWESYLKGSHLPALREMVRVPRPPRAVGGEPRAERVPDGPPGIAFFDIEGVVLDTTVAHFYAWLRTREMAGPDRALWLLGLAAKAPSFLAADRHSRTLFNRRFYREYRGLPVAELKEQAAEALSEFILPRVRHGAVRRIREHRRKGDRVVFVTGALDFLVEPLSHLADDLVAARLVEERGAFTGELVEPPMSADGRASLTARIAAERGVDLAHCSAYGDSVSDLPMLEGVGHPFAVCPDFRLAREARRRRWPVLEWQTEPGARTAPSVPAGA
jgi:alcohol-forming fatty acyl-CoA reductase